LNLTQMLDEKHITLDLRAEKKVDVLRELVAMLDDVAEPELVVNMLLRREELGSTGIGIGVAIPHGRTGLVRNVQILLGRSTRGVEFDSIDKKPAHMLFLVVAPPKDAGNQYLISLGRIAVVSQDLSRQRRYMQPKTPKEMLDLIASVEKRLR